MDQNIRVYVQPDSPTRSTYTDACAWATTQPSEYNILIKEIPVPEEV